MKKVYPVVHLINGPTLAEMVKEPTECTIKALGDTLRWHLLGTLVYEELPSLLNDIEVRLYPYGTKANDSFELRLLEWKEMPWSIVSFPKTDHSKVHEIVVHHGFRFRTGSVPLVIEVLE